MLVNARPLRDDQGEIAGGPGRLPRHHPAEERRAAARRPVRGHPRPGRGRFAERGRSPDPRGHRPAPGLGLRRLLAGRPRDPPVAVRHALARAGDRPRPSFEEPTREIAFAIGRRPAGPRLGEPRGRLDRRPLPGLRTSRAGRPRPRRPALRASPSPILVRGECLGVLEFFSRERRAPDDRSCSR